jgi:hypothetical protein
MKFALAAITLLAAATMVNTVAMAQKMNADDMKWINQCIDDNKGAKVKPEVVRAYCQCMNDLMDDNDTQSVTQWEKTHKAEMATCDKKSGWDR